jgi:hypothetical protein
LVLPKEARVRKSLIALGFIAAACVAAGLAVAQDKAPAPAVPAAGVPVASVCTNLPETDCGTTSGCVWLPGYKVATGEEIKGYCRPAPKPLTARRPPGAASAAEQPK